MQQAVTTCNALNNKKVNITVRKKNMLQFLEQRHMTKMVLAAFTIPYDKLFTHTIIKHLMYK